MLILTRKVGEEIVIDGSIRVTITAIQGGQVRIGITAPPEIAIQRQEVWQRIREFADAEEAAIAR